MGWMSLVGAGLTAFGDIAGGIATQNADNYNAQVARNNAIAAAQAGEVQAQNQSLRGAANLGHAKAAYGANNVTLYQPGQSSVGNVTKSVRMSSQVNAINTENNALVTAYGYNAQASVDVAEGQSALIGGIIKGAGAAAGGIGQYYGGGGGGGGGGGSSEGGGSGGGSGNLGQSLQSTALPPANYAGSDDLSPSVG